MISVSPSEEKNPNNREVPNNSQDSDKDQEEKVLCQHCGRTANNGIKCRGICVADSDY